jgi:hypothetical protein
MKYLYWLDIAVKIAQAVQGLFTPVIAVVIGYFTWRIQRQQVITQQQQAETTRLQYRFGLMERRMKVFDATMGFIALVIRKARMETIEPILKLDQDTREHHLLFGSEIGAYLNELEDKAVTLNSFDAAEGAMRPEHVQPAHEVLLWFRGQPHNAREMFAKYLDFRKP